MSRRTKTKPRESRPAADPTRNGSVGNAQDAIRTREQLLAWLGRVMNELHWMSDKLIFERPPFVGAISPELCNELGVMLDGAWHRMARCLPLGPPAEFREDSPSRS